MENNAVRYQPWKPQSFHDDDPGAPVSSPQDGAPGSEFVRGPQGSSGGESDFEPHAAAAGAGQVDFAALKFQRESTLLTNADEYAASIRNEAELYVRQLRAEVDALNAGAEQRYAEAQSVKEQAESEAAALVAQAQGEADSVRDTARQEGFEAGREEGLRRRYEEAGEHLKSLEAIFNQLSQFRRQVRFYVEKDSIRLAVLLAKKILQQELKINKQVVLQILAKTLAGLEGTGTFRVWLHPEDHQFALAARPALEKFLGEEQSLSLRTKPDLAKGSVLIESDRDVIDATLASQLHHLDAAITQTLAERETVVTKGERSKPQRTAPKSASAKPAPAKPPAANANAPKP
jgi:flagellar assembly protein FliH